MLTNRNTGTPYRSSNRHSVRVWPWTPSVPLITRMAQSSTRSVRSVSAEKSTWPGVSSSVTSKSPSGSTACLEKMVMPRSRSMASVSRKASRWSTRPSFRMEPLRYNRASDSVVFPASTWAMTPIQIRFISQTTFVSLHISGNRPGSRQAQIFTPRLICSYYGRFFTVLQCLSSCPKFQRFQCSGQSPRIAQDIDIKLAWRSDAAEWCSVSRPQCADGAFLFRKNIRCRGKLTPDILCCS